MLSKLLWSLAKSCTTIGIFIPQNANFLIVSILCCVGRVSIDKVDKRGIQMGHRGYWEGRGVSERRQGWGNRSNRLTLNLLTTTIVAPTSNARKWQMGFNSAFKGLREHSGAAKSGESAGKLCEGAETCMCRAESKVRQPGSRVRKEWSGTLRDHSSTERLSWKFAESIQSA